MEIRRIREGDSRAALSRVYEESWKYAYRGILPQAYLDSIPEGQWANAVDHSGMSTLVLLEEGCITGTASFCKARELEMKTWGEIVSIYLLPASMGKGFGKKLFQFAVEELRQMGFRTLFLWVLEENRTARRFYEGMGLHPNGEERAIEIGGESFKEVRYILEKEIGH